MLRRTKSRSVAASWPATRAVPEVAFASVQRILMVVVLPAPLGPRKPKVSPLVTSKSMPRTAWTSPYCLVRPETDMTAPGPPLLPPGSSPATTRPAFAPVCVTTAAASLTSSPQRLAVVSVVRRARTVTWIAGGLGVLVVSGEYPVQRLACIRQDLARVPHLGVGPRAHDLECGHGDLTDEVAHLDSRVSDRARHDVPGRPDLLWVRVNVGAALLGQPVAPATAVARLGAGQALALELLQRGLDRTGARTPHAVAPLADRLDDLVAIHRLLGQQRQRRRTDVASLCPRPAHPAQARIAKPGPEHVEARRAAMTRDRHGHPPTGGPGAADMTATAAAAPPHAPPIT